MNQQVVLITGGAGGIGLASAELLVQGGAKVVIADNNQEQGEKAERALGEFGENVKFIKVDVTNLDSVNELMNKTIALFGGLDILFNNAGVLGGNRFPESDPQAWRRAVDVNIIGVMNCIYAAVPHLKAGKQSTILNMGSTAGLKASFLDPTYAMTKGAIVNLTRSLTFMLEEFGININCLCPTLVKTDLAANSSNSFSADELAKFTERRGNRNDRPSLTVEAVAQAAIKLMFERNLNGYCCEMTLENAWNLIPPVIPQKV